MTDLFVYNKSRIVEHLPSQIGSILRQPLRLRLRLGGADSISNLGPLRDAAHARLAAAVREGVLDTGSAKVSFGRLTETGVELLITVRVCGGKGFGMQGLGRRFRISGRPVCSLARGLRIAGRGLPRIRANARGTTWGRAGRGVGQAVVRAADRDRCRAADHGGCVGRAGVHTQFLGTRGGRSCGAPGSRAPGCSRYSPHGRPPATPSCFGPLPQGTLLSPEFGVSAKGAQLLLDLYAIAATHGAACATLS